MRFLALLLFLIPILSHADVEPVLIRTLTEVTGGGLSVTGSSVVVQGIYNIRTASITVISGTGFKVFSSTGGIVQCAINPPLASAEYSFEIVTNDPDEFPIIGYRGLVGKSSLSFFRFI